MTAITTNLKTQVQAQIDAADSSTSLKDLLVIRKSAEGLRCDESNLDTLMSAAIASMSPSTALKDLLLGNKASGLPGPVSVPIGGSTPLLASFPSLVSIDGASYLKSGYYLTTGFDESLMPYMSGGRVWANNPANIIGSNTIQAIKHDNGLWVVAGDNGMLSTSPDGVTWTPRTSGFGTTRIKDVSFGNGLWVAVGDNGMLSTSPDGVTWTPRTSGFGTEIISAVAYANNLWVASGTNGKLSTSPDGVTWTPRTSGASTNLGAIVYGKGVWVVAVQTGAPIISYDGITWSAAYVSGTTTSFTTVAFNGEIFVGCSGTNIGYSVDGWYWAPVAPNIPVAAVNKVIWNKKDLFVFTSSSGGMPIYTCDANLKNFKSRANTSSSVAIGTDGLVCIAGISAGTYRKSEAVLCLESENKNDFLRIL
jgi:photosystem II stability/assembly factor-like uncharacterized protein